MSQGPARAFIADVAHQGKRRMTGPNAYLTKRERPSINKHDALDALSVARITAKYIHELPDADIDPLQWALLSTVTHRRGLVGDQNRLKNKLGNLLHQAWPEYRGFSPSRSMA